ncbi:MAG: methylaspartate mutase [Desulfuromonas sp. SDB]|nr:MAG: methylaspartate mutase [Desulfuromonas sp. SDB]
MKPKEQIKNILATDCGSTTTKAILIQYDPEAGRYRLIVRGEAPTTVEAPFEDVTIGVLNSVKEVEELTHREILQQDKIIKESSENRGVDIYISTSSAGGGLQMMVAGVVMNMTAESAERAALGAGSIVMDAIATNDKRMPHERIERIRNLRPDMILLSGGIDGGTIKHVTELAEIIAAADPKPRFGSTYKLPVIYAGNKDAREPVKERLEGKTDLFIVDNLRPVLERENLQPARDKIHDLFMEHVMAQAPGYKKLMSWADVDIMPTPGAVGLLIETVAKQEDIEVVGVDIGGATTDVFSVFKDRTEEEEKPVFNRTVSANLGMSYSISNVMAEAGLDNILRWVPFTMEEKDLRNRIRNKMIRPTTIPQSLQELKVEQAIAREALRLAFVQHKQMAVGLKGIQQERTIADAFEQVSTGETLVNLMNLNMLIGSGGVLSHAPRRAQAALMMIDAFLPQGITMLAVDSIFMMPHLGVLSKVHPQAATEVFDNDCLIRLGHCIAPVEKKRRKGGEHCFTLKIENRDELKIAWGELKLIPLGEGEKVKATIIPERHYDVGDGYGKSITITLEGGVVGLVVDARGRNPFSLPSKLEERINKLEQWNKALNIYPEKE